MLRCIECGKQYTTKYTYSKKYLSKRKFCSLSCMLKNKEHRKTFFQKGHKDYNHKGEESTSWKGKKAGYSAKHRWVRRKKGTPNKCEHCGTTTANRYEWANIDHKYKRNLDDYIRLCCSCHYKYDKKNGLRKK